MDYTSVDRSKAFAERYHDVMPTHETLPVSGFTHPFKQSDKSIRPSNNVTWTLIKLVQSRTRSVGIVSQHDDMTAAPEGSSYTLRVVRNLSNYGVSTSRAMGHWIGRATGAVFGFGIGGLTGLVQQRLGRGFNEQTAQASRSIISEKATTGLRAGADAGEWVGGHVARMLVNVCTLGAPAVIDYLDRSFNGE